MPRWPVGYVAGKRQTCACGGPKDFDAVACRKCHTPAKPLEGRTGEAHPAWKGGSRLDRDGYTRTYAPDHPWPRRGGYVHEHVRVMELSIGRRIRPGEVVHHKNHDRNDNALGNLELMAAGEHSSHHRKQDTVNRTRDAHGRFGGRQ